MTMWFALCLLTCWTMGIRTDNYTNSGKLGIKTNAPTPQPAVQDLMDTSSSPSIVLTLDVSASMEYQVCIFTLCIVSYISHLLPIYQWCCNGQLCVFGCLSRKEFRNWALLCVNGFTVFQVAFSWEWWNSRKEQDLWHQGSMSLICSHACEDNGSGTFFFRL
jgi:hypothetical protein